MYTRETNLTQIKEALVCVDNYCTDMVNHFPNYENMNYGEAVDYLIHKDKNEMIRNIITNLIVLGEENTEEINDSLLIYLTEDDIIGHLRFLLVWRKIKSYQISDDVKARCVKYFKGKVPNAEKSSDYLYNKGVKDAS